MKLRENIGLTLVELIMAVAILGIIASAATALLTTALQAHEMGTERSALYREGLLAMDRMSESIRMSTFVMIPNAHMPVRDILAVSGVVNDDGDYYFDDPLLPRIDEDVRFEMVADVAPGIAGYDDDGDGEIDEGSIFDDDEDGLIDEDWLDGIDNDGDGNIDEDLGYNGGSPGVTGMDDDGDGSVDEMNPFDDDEDGAMDEDLLNPIIFVYDGATRSLQQRIPATSEVINLAENVGFFQVTYEAPERIRLQLTLVSDHGESVAFSEYVYPRNVYQRNGKRVR